MTVFTETVECFYAQILDCGLTKIEGFHTYGQILAIFAWMTVVLGFISISVSVALRWEKARTLGEAPSVWLNQFEWFLVTFTVSAVLGSTALTLSAFVNVSSTVFYALIGPRWNHFILM
ncbi:hypothetical protein HDU67_007422 [Dinochytrium kinnereticum]|nr:hypothetical protein HDU67_007422 [Dinochytrium kinnereticum]